MTSVDAHHHLWDLNAREHAWLDEPSLAPVRRTFALRDLADAVQATPVCHTVLVQVLPDLTETVEFLALAATSELISGVVGWIDLTSEDVAGTLAKLREEPGGDRLVGIRHLVQGEADPRWLNRPDVGRGLRAIGEAGLSYDLLTLPHQLPAAIETVRAHPGTTFVLDHLSKPPIASGALQPWETLVRELAAAPNVFAKLSGLVTEADWANWTVDTLRPYVDVALDAFGPHRLMFGSDWPVSLLAASYTDVLQTTEQLVAELSPAERDEILGTTACRAYRLRT
jgi:L-fuconolactonase